MIILAPALFSFLAQAGPVVAAQKVPQKPYGFVEMADESSADYAVKLFLYGTVRLFGRYIRIQVSHREIGRGGFCNSIRFELDTFFKRFRHHK